MTHAQTTCEFGDDAGFAAVLRTLRRWHFGKQLALAAAVGCTEAAISYWENGKRAPDARKFPTIAGALSQAGASPAALDRLRTEWERARTPRPTPATGSPAPRHQ